MYNKPQKKKNNGPIILCFQTRGGIKLNPCRRIVNKFDFLFLFDTKDDGADKNYLYEKGSKTKNQTQFEVCVYVCQTIFAHNTMQVYCNMYTCPHTYINLLYNNVPMFWNIECFHLHINNI